MYHSSATQNNHFYSASPVLNVGIIKVAIDDSLVLYAALFGPRICGSRPNRFSNQKKPYFSRFCWANSDAAQRESRQRVHVGICSIARSRTVHTSSMKAVETRTRTVVRNDQFISASACQSDPYTWSATQTLNERHAVIIYPFTHPCQCARFLRASTLFGSDNASKIFILLAKYLISVVL